MAERPTVQEIQQVRRESLWVQDVGDVLLPRQHQQPHVRQRDCDGVGPLTEPAWSRHVIAQTEISLILVRRRADAVVSRPDLHGPGRMVRPPSSAILC